jgi:hypothetical protein
MNAKGNIARIENPSNIYIFQHVIAKRCKKTKITTSWGKKHTTTKGIVAIYILPITP